MPTRAPSSRMVSAARPSSRTSAHAAARISRRVASVRSERLTSFGIADIVRKGGRGEAACQEVVSPTVSGHASARRGTRMRAAVYDRYGPPDVLRIADVPAPATAAGQVLVEVAATSVNLSDWESLT